MSLIFTSNTQDDYKNMDDEGRRTRALIGIENPADYHNHLTSPLEVKPDSQIAVQSVKITRDQVYEVSDGQNLLYYHGELLGNTKSLRDTTTRPELITIARGSYSREEFAAELQKQLDTACLPPAVFNNFEVNVSLVDNDFKGFTINASQHGPNYSNKVADMDTSIADVNASIGSTPQSDSFTYANGLFTRTGSAGTLTDGLCCGIGTDFPLSIGQNSSFTIDLRGASRGAAANASWCVGLTRPTLQTNNDNSRGKNHGNAPLEYIKTPAQSHNTPHYYDYLVSFEAGNGKDAGILTVHQSCNLEQADGTTEPNSFKTYEIGYYGAAGQTFTGAVTNASMLNGFYEKLIWEIEGDEVRVALYNTAKSQKDYLIDSRLTKRTMYSFKPLNQYTSALYPKFQVSEGSLLTTHFTTYSQSSTTYKYPTLTGADPITLKGGTYNVGNSPYSNYVSYTRLMDSHLVEGEQPCWSRRGVGQVFIFPPDSTGRDQRLPVGLNPAASVENTYVGCNSASGVAYEHLLVLEDSTPPTYRDEFIGNYYSEMCHISQALGFPDTVLLTQARGTLTNVNMVTWKSFDVPLFIVGSAFIRVPNLNSRTYNACKNSVSKMLYHIPRFTNDGRQFGDLFFEVGERTYVDLGNTESFMLNQMIVQLVDKNERIIGDLTGETIVVFHIRQKKEAGQFE